LIKVEKVRNIVVAIISRVNNFNRNLASMASQTNTNEQLSDRQFNEHQRWIENRIQEGVFECYSQSDIGNRMVVDAGGCGIIYKAILKISGERVAIKKLYSFPYSCEKTLDKMLVKEVG